MKEKLIIIGAGGHSKVLLDIALKNDYEVLGFLDDRAAGTEHAGYPVLGKVEQISEYKNQACFVIGIGSNQVRKNISETYDVNWATLVHPQAVIGMGVTIVEGTVVMAGAVVNPFAQIGKHCIINTSCVVEHDNQLADYVHICPGAVLAGTVSVGEATQIGANAVVKNNVTVAGNCIIGAGAAVVKNITEEGVYAGVPAGRIR